MNFSRGFLKQTPAVDTEFFLCFTRFKLLVLANNFSKFHYIWTYFFLTARNLFFLSNEFIFFLCLFHIFKSRILVAGPREINFCTYSDEKLQAVWEIFSLVSGSILRAKKSSLGTEHS